MSNKKKNQFGDIMINDNSGQIALGNDITQKQVVDSRSREEEPNRFSADVTRQMNRLQAGLRAGFNLAELRSLTLSLGVDFEELSGTNKLEKIDALIGHFARRQRLDVLRDACVSERPSYDWQSEATEKHGE